MAIDAEINRTGGGSERKRKHQKKQKDVHGEGTVMYTDGQVNARRLSSRRVV
jgi:hypothetical protein